MNYYIILSDILWYTGHVLSGLSIIVTHTNYYLAVSLVCFGQFITILSRPIGRITRDETRPTILLEIKDDVV